MVRTSRRQEWLRQWSERMLLSAGLACVPERTDITISKLVLLRQIVLIPPVSDDPPNIPTFGTFAEKYIASGEDRWKNPHHQQSWRVSLRDYAKQLLEVPIDQIGKEDVYSVLEPIWQRLPQTAVRLRARIEKILDAAQTHGLRPQESPRSATWRDHMARMLPLPPKLAQDRLSVAPVAAGAIIHERVAQAAGIDGSMSRNDNPYCFARRRSPKCYMG